MLLQVVAPPVDQQIVPVPVPANSDASTGTGYTPPPPQVITMDLSEGSSTTRGTPKRRRMSAPPSCKPDATKNLKDPKRDDEQPPRGGMGGYVSA